MCTLRHHDQDDLVQQARRVSNHRIQIAIGMITFAQEWHNTQRI